ncbi:SIR2 family protein [Brassicibacter mesophilus]|uniref:SIR2 family protein n=1 Tax=Brassicibacter mesophilus TaxID=745119 RepID=UPI003D1FF4AA
MSSISIQEFEREYLKALKNESAAVFAGAGMSRVSGYVEWKELLREFAEDINLKVEKEDDLVSLAQYYYNQRGGNRSIISNKIIEEFTKETKQNENLEILTSLPIEKYWTTNYDSLIEDTLKNYSNRKVDVKRTVENLTTTLPGRDAIVYKMHGDITQPHNAVIIKDDYESYNEKRQLFTTSLQGDLVSKTFLFIGFSFEDPNLIYILSRIRILLGEEHNRMHYCFIREVKESEYQNHEDFIYDKTKQELRIQDLKRYGISAVLVKEYSEITESLRRIQFKHNLNSILISGSAEIYGDMDEDKAGQFIYTLSNQLVKRNFKIVTGYGKGIGTYVVSGVLEEVYENKYGHVSTYLTPRPFPFIHKGDIDIQEIAKNYRKTIVDECGVVIFIFGNKTDKETGEIVNASGVYQEFKIANEKDKVIIPIGSTGFMSKKILEEVENDLEKYWYLKDSIDVLMDELDPVKVFAEISKVITKVKGA